MAWDTEIVLRVRYLVNDIDATSYAWTDSQLKTFVLLATTFVVSDLQKWSIAASYTIDIVNQTITPDPTDEESDIVVNLISLKTAELLGRAEFKKNAMSAGVKVTDDRSSIDTTLQASSLNQILKAYELTYSLELQRYKAGIAFEGKAVLSPYASYSAVSGIL